MNFYISEIGNLKSLYGDMIKPTFSKKSAGYNRDTAVARLDEINTSLSKGDTTQIELFKKDIQDITNWYSGIAAIYLDIEKGLREAKKLIRQNSK